MRHGTRRIKAGTESLRDVARQLAHRLQANEQDFRYVQMHCFDGQQWTTEAFWEQRVDGQWVRVDWTDYVL